MKQWRLIPAMALGVAFIAPAGANAGKPIPEFQKGSIATPGKDSPLAKLGFDKRFYKKGDSWSVAWSFKKRNWILKVAPSGYSKRPVTFSEPAVVNYRVVEVATSRLGDKRRTLARISATWAREALGQSHNEAVITVDQNMNPVALRVRTRGQTAFVRKDIDTRASIVGLGTIPFYLPKMVGEVDPGTWVPVPTASRAFSKVKPFTASGTRSLALKVTRDEQYIARTFWVPGNLYASYVGGPNVEGVLVGQGKAR